MVLAVIFRRRGRGMQKSCMYFGALFAVAAASLWGSPAGADSNSAMRALRGESAIKDLVFDPKAAVQWQIGVLSDGTRRYGYAQYVCEVLKENGAVDGSTEVRILDIVQVTQGKNFRSASLGRVNCKTFKQSYP